MPEDFSQLAHDFIHGRYALEPVAATVAGIHDHDARLGDFSAQGFAERDRFVDEWLGKLEPLVESDLFPSERVDRALILSELRGDRALRDFARWRRQPTLYSDAVTRGAYYAFLREHAPLAERVATLAERLAEAPGVIGDAKRNLDPDLVPREWIDVALRSVPAGAVFLRETAPTMLVISRPSLPLSPTRSSSTFAGGGALPSNRCRVQT